MGQKLYQSKRKYCKISYQKRLRLIDLVENQKMGVTRASKKLRIKIPTAKVILSTFRRRGQVFKKKGEQSPKLPCKTPLIEPEPLSSPLPDVQTKLEPTEAECGGWMFYYPVMYFLPTGTEAPMIHF